MRAILNNKIVVWVLLAVPGAGMVLEVRGGALAMDQIEPSGRWAVWLLLVAISAGPLLDLIGPRALIQWLVRMRRSFGVAAFGYAALHLGFYSMDIGALDEMIAEIGLPGIWTGWLALLLMAVPAVISNGASVRALRSLWKRLQRLVYPVAALTLVHWALLEQSYTEAILTFAPFLTLTMFRILKAEKRKTSQ